LKNENMKMIDSKKHSAIALLFSAVCLVACNKFSPAHGEGFSPEPETELPGTSELSGGPLELLFTETFDTGSLSSKTWIHLQSGNQNYSAIVNGALRHNLRTGLGGTDPISGKTRSGLQTHTFLASNFYDADTIGAITFEMKFRFDQSFWKTTAGDAFPIGAGKLFLSDTDYDSNGPYLGLTNYGT